MIARTHIKFASIFCGPGSENQNYSQPVRVSTVLPVQPQKWQIDQLSLIVAVLLYIFLFVYQTKFLFFHGKVYKKYINIKIIKNTMYRK